MDNIQESTENVTNVGEPRKHAKLQKPDTKVHILRFHAYEMSKTGKLQKQTSGCQGWQEKGSGGCSTDAASHKETTFWNETDVTVPHYGMHCHWIIHFKTHCRLISPQGEKPGSLLCRNLPPFWGLVFGKPSSQSRLSNCRHPLAGQVSTASNSIPPRKSAQGLLIHTTFFPLQTHPSCVTPPCAQTKPLETDL